MSHPIGLFYLAGHAVHTFLTTPLTAVVIGVAVGATLVGIMCLLSRAETEQN